MEIGRKIQTFSVSIGSVFIIVVVPLAFRLHPDPTVTTKPFYL